MPRPDGLSKPLNKHMCPLPSWPAHSPSFSPEHISYPSKNTPRERKTSAFLSTKPSWENQLSRNLGNALIFRNWSPAGYQLLIWTKSIIFFLSSETVFSPKNNDETISLIRIFLHARNFLYLLSILPNSSFTGIVLLPSVTTSLSPQEPVSTHFAGFFEQNIVTSSPGLSFLVWHRGRRPETTVPRPFCQCGFFLDPSKEKHSWKI